MVVVVVEGLKVELQLSTLTLQFTVLLSAVLYRMTCPGVKAIQIDITKIEIHADPDPTGFSLGFSFTAPIRAFWRYMYLLVPASFIELLPRARALVTCQLPVSSIPVGTAP